MADPTPQTSPHQVKWTREDAVNARAYILSHPRFLEYLWQSRGKLDASNGAEMGGFERCFETIRNMMADIPAGDIAESVNIADD